MRNSRDVGFCRNSLAVATNIRFFKRKNVGDIADGSALDIPDDWVYNLYIDTAKAPQY
ncbi:MAG: hypothetical protein KIG74_01550 [Clostridiaceae bacterium]|nr:hypothetical protein [Clostridiaceae bacterium]